MLDYSRSSTRPRAQPRVATTVAKAERTRAAIMDAALEFLWSNPFRDMSVSRLMTATKLSRPAFYQYFHDVHHLMIALLEQIEQDILVVAQPWLEGTDEPVPRLEQSLSELVRVCYAQGPILRAVADAAPTDTRLEETWKAFLGRFDDAVTARIEQDQKAGLIPAFTARPVAVALNRMDAHVLIHAFGRRPRSEPGPVRDAILRIWINTLYGPASIAEFGGDESAKERKA